MFVMRSPIMVGWYLYTRTAPDSTVQSASPVKICVIVYPWTVSWPTNTLARQIRRNASRCRRRDVALASLLTNTANLMDLQVINSALGNKTSATLQWRHNERNGVSNHRRLDCLFKRLFRRRSKKTSKHCVTGLCERNSTVAGQFPKEPFARKMFSFDDITTKKHQLAIHLVLNDVDFVMIFCFISEVNPRPKHAPEVITFFQLIFVIFDISHWKFCRAHLYAHLKGISRCNTFMIHYNDVIMCAIASQITSLTIVYSIVYSDADHRKHQRSTSLAFVRGIIPRTNGQ